MSEQNTLSERLRLKAIRLLGGVEKPDPTPVQIPIEMRKPESMDDRIRRIIQHSLSVRARQVGLESFEEADDFDIEDEFDLDPTSPWEENLENAIIDQIKKGHAEPPKGLDPARYEELRNKYSPKKKSAPSEPPTPEPQKEPPKGS